VVIHLAGNLGPYFRINVGRFYLRAIYAKHVCDDCWVRMEKSDVANAIEKSA